MIVGHKTERFISVQRHTNPAHGYLLIGHEVVTALHSTKGWRCVANRRQIIGSCERRDVGRARAAGSSATFERIGNANRNYEHRGAHPIPITEWMLMRHGWYRRSLKQETANVG